MTLTPLAESLLTLLASELSTTPAEPQAPAQVQQPAMQALPQAPMQAQNGLMQTVPQAPMQAQHPVMQPLPQAPTQVQPVPHQAPVQAQQPTMQPLPQAPAQAQQASPVPMLGQAAALPPALSGSHYPLTHGQVASMTVDQINQAWDQMIAPQVTR